jgi:autotransporter-associated beta strand protein
LLAKQGAGTLVLGGASTYSGETFINNGKIQLSTSSDRLPTTTILSLGQAASTNLGTFDLNGQSQQIAGLVSTTGTNAAATKNTVTSATAATLTINVASGVTKSYGDGTVTNSGVITGALSLEKSGLGTQVLGDANTYSGTTTISAGTLQVGAGGTTGTLAGAIINNAALIFNHSGPITAANVISGTGNMTKAGAGTLTLSGANTFTGTSTISAGTLLVGHLTALGTGAITVNGGTLDLNATTIGQIANVITVTSGLVIGGAAASAAPTSGTVAVTTVLTGAADLTKADAGTLTLSTPHFHTGATVANVAGAVIRASHLADTGSSLGAGTLTDPTKLQLGAGAVLEFTGATTTTSTRSFTVTDSAGITTAAGAAGLTFTAAAKIALVGATPALALVANNSVTNFFRASLSDADLAAGNGLKTLTIDGAGVWVIGGSSNRFKGDVRIDAGAGSTIGLESSALPSGAGTNVVIALANNARARYEAGNTDDLSGQLSLAAGATGKLDLGNNNVAFNSALAVTTGTGSTATLSKEGSGKLTIAAGNNTNLNVAVTAGTLVVNSSLGNVTLASGTTLGGAGTVGAVTTVSGSTISPGNSPGNLTSSSLALVGGSIFQWQVQDATAAAGTGYDTLTVTNALDLSNANSGNRIILNISSLAGNGNGTALGNPLNFGPSSIRPFTFATVGSLNLGSNTNINDAFTITVGDFHYTDGSTSNAGLWALSFAANTVTLTALPEPSTYGLGLGALALAAAAIRRRKQKAKAQA